MNPKQELKQAMLKACSRHTCSSECKTFKTICEKFYYSEQKKMVRLEATVKELTDEIGGHLMLVMNLETNYNKLGEELDRAKICNEKLGAEIDRLEENQ